MPQLMVYFDDEATRKLDAAARRAGVSRAAWIRRAVQQRLDEELPETYFGGLTGWIAAGSTAETTKRPKKDSTARSVTHHHG